MAIVDELTETIGQLTIECERSGETIRGVRYRCKDARLARIIGLNICETEYLKLDDAEKQRYAISPRVPGSTP